MENQEHSQDVYSQWKKAEATKQISLTDQKLREYVSKMVNISFMLVEREELIAPYFFVTPIDELHDSFVRYNIRTPDQEVASVKLEIINPFGKDTDSTPLIHTLSCIFSDEVTLHTQYCALNEIGRMVKGIYHTSLYSDRYSLSPKHALLWEKLCAEKLAKKTPYKTLKDDPIYQYTGSSA